MDDHGNLSAVVVNDEVHISSNFTHHPMRGSGDRLQILKNEAESKNVNWLTTSLKT